MYSNISTYHICECISYNNKHGNSKIIFCDQCGKNIFILLDEHDVSGLGGNSGLKETTAKPSFLVLFKMHVVEWVLLKLGTAFQIEVLSSFFTPLVTFVK